MTKEYKKFSLQSQFSVSQEAHTCPLGVKTEKLSIASHNVHVIRDPLQVLSLGSVKNLGHNSKCARELVLVRIHMKTGYKKTFMCK